MNVVVIVLALAFCLWLFSFVKRRDLRRKLLTTKLSAKDRATIVQQVPILAKLPTEFHAALEGKVSLFLHQVKFFGCDGLEVTDDMRLAIAAQASLLVVNKPTWYKTLRTVLIYPGAFKSQQVQSNGFVETISEKIRIGESWARGPVILSWAHAKKGAFIDDDGHNVVIHEFAHQLDDLSGATDGAPVLTNDQSPESWAAVFRKAYHRLVHDVEEGRETFLDSYGATAPEEFFATSVEYFFEKSKSLKEKEPTLYAELSTYFGLDPANW